MEVVRASILKKIYKKRDPWSHKYNFGHLLVIGGSKHYSGSPALNALAALRAGVDLVTIVAPERAANIIASFLPDLIAYPLKGDYLCGEHLDEIVKLTHNKNAVVIGGGLTREREVLETVVEYLERIDLPCVIDADAIHAVATKKEVIKNKNAVLTPHSHEFLVLSGIQVSKDLSQRIKAVKETAERLKTTILLKGHVDVISNGKEVALNKTGSPFLTKGGMGDTLAGICGALLARGNDCFTSACASAYINGLAGEIAAKKLRESITATDLIASIHEAIKF
ncbi:MAG: NAD(P)H-hydrate dehydratase [Candidatus Aenigmarchaeota archaeon]|nr:NAD(P)H-hydrate dehydratase [Candidatus Aenigmarchaeota archaeon]